MTILLTGAGGQLGMEIQRAAGISPFAILATDFSDLDITNFDALERLFSPSFDLVINCAAYTAVDKAETEQKAAFAVNRDGPRNLAKVCARHEVPLIHISTDYVFDGSQRRPYSEQDSPHPMGVYAVSKEEGEREIRRHHSKHLIFRTSWLHSSFGNNFVKTILRLAQERETLKVVCDQHGCPTSAKDLAEAVLGVVKRLLRGSPPAWGTYHFCNRGVTNWHEFASEIVRIASERVSSTVKEVLPITTDQYPLPAPRPVYSALDTNRYFQTFGVQPRTWQDSLKEVIQELCPITSKASGTANLP